MTISKEEFDIMERRCAKNRQKPPPTPESLDHEEGTPLEQKFLALWEAYGGPSLTREAKLIPDRKFHFDFTHDQSRVVIEIEGGVWIGGRHTSGSGFVADCEKYLLATLAGYVVIRLVSEMLREETIKKLIRYCEIRAAETQMVRECIGRFNP